MTKLIKSMVPCPKWMGRFALILLGSIALAGGQSAYGARPTPSATVELVYSFDYTFQPGYWTGFILGPSSDIGPYLVEVSPLGASSVNGAYFTTQVQREFDGNTWNDVMRIQLLPSGVGNQVEANVRVFRLGSR